MGSNLEHLLNLWRSPSTLNKDWKKWRLPLLHVEGMDALARSGIHFSDKYSKVVSYPQSCRRTCFFSSSQQPLIRNTCVPYCWKYKVNLISMEWTKIILKVQHNIIHHDKQAFFGINFVGIIFSSLEMKRVTSLPDAIYLYISFIAKTFILNDFLLYFGP